MKPNTVVVGWPNNWRKREDDGTKVLVNTIRSAAAGKMALLVPKGIQRFPDSGDTVKVPVLSSSIDPVKALQPTISKWPVSPVYCQ